MHKSPSIRATGALRILAEAILVAVSAAAMAQPSPAARDSCAAAIPRPHPGKPVIIVLDPLVRIGVNGESDSVSWSRGRNSATRDSYASALITAARDHIASRGDLMLLTDLSPGIQDCFKDLKPLTGRLSRGNLNDETESALEHIGPESDVLILAQSIHVEPGPGRTWDTFSGAITSAMQSTQIEASLISLATRTAVWKQSQLVRNRALKPDEGKMLQTLDSLYQSFPATLEKRP